MAHAPVLRTPRTFITMDVSLNWEPHPTFVDYESILARHCTDKLSVANRFSGPKI